jgi:N-succinyldiaminopimelate aminotransferase
MSPPVGLRLQDVHQADFPAVHKYANPHGHAPLLEALVDKVRARNSIPIEGPSNILITPGATGALHGAAAATVAPGDEVLIVAPYWPLIRGVVQSCNAVPVDLPLWGIFHDAEAVAEVLDAHITERTVAVYVSTPSNPTGRILPESVLAVIADRAARHNLWIWSDEVYEDYNYVAPHISIGSLLPDRVLTAFSFSKAYGMSGHRCGYLVGPSNVMRPVRKSTTYAWYSTPTGAQILAERALRDGQEWVATARASYEETGRAAAARLGVPAPEGSTFLFLDVADHLDERGLVGFLEGCLEDNLILAPGTSFGAAYDTYVRVCFTCSPPEVVLRGVDKLAARLRSS